MPGLRLIFSIAYCYYKINSYRIGSLIRGILIYITLIKKKMQQKISGIYVFLQIVVSCRLLVGAKHLILPNRLIYRYII